MNNQMQIYVGTYGKYNSGNLFGEWVDISDFSDYESFIDYATELHSDEDDPEFMIQDYSGFPQLLYSESMTEEDFDAIKAWERFNELSDSEKLSLWSEYSPDNTVYDFDEDTINQLFSSPWEFGRAVAFGDVNFGHNYFTFNGYGNIETIDDPMDIVDENELFEYYKENN